MKAFSIKQPWATLVCTPRKDDPTKGIKDIENRTWRTNYRGKVFIHASAKSAEVQFSTQQTADLFLNEIWIPDVGFKPELFPTSAIIGEVEIVDCVINHESIWAEETFISIDESEGYPQKPTYNWVLANAILYDKPILNVKGKLSFWEPEIDIVECIGCSGKFDSEQMEEDDGNEKFCKECWDVLAPIMAQEAKENRENQF